MTWNKRDSKFKAPKGRSTPSYGLALVNFTIKLHHSGKFRDYGKIVYEDGKVDYFDYCDFDRMSLCELHEMLRECGVKSEGITLYLSKKGVDNCEKLILIDSDRVVGDLKLYVDRDDCVGFWVDHGESFISEDPHVYSGTVDPNVYIGDGLDTYEKGDEVDEDEVEAEVEEDDEVDEVEGDEVDEDDGEEVDEAEVNEVDESEGDEDEVVLESTVNDNLPPQTEQELVDGNDKYIAVDDQTVGSDSDYSDMYYDSEGVGSDEENLKLYGEIIGSGLEMAPPMESTRVEYYGGNRVFSPKVDMVDPKFFIGLMFEDAVTLRKAIRRHSLLIGRELVWMKNDSDRIRVKCAGERCNWFLYAASFRGEKKKSFQIKSMGGKHSTCKRQQKLKAANSVYMAEKYYTNIKTNPTWPTSSMVEVARNDTRLEVSRFQMYRAKKRVQLMLGGTEKQQYGLLWRYAAEIKKVDPDTNVKIHQVKNAEGKSMFKRMYICWGAMKKGFKDGCRPILCVDGCHLKSHSGGILLTAIGIDPNDGMYPVAYAVVEKEKKETWLWFFEYLLADLEVPNDITHFCVMSDKQKGLIDAVETLLPNSEHRFCLLHMYNNFKQSHSGLALKKLLWKAAKCTRIVEFEEVLQEMLKLDKTACAWVVKKPAIHWSKAYFSTHVNSDLLLNNLCESFNKMILKARKKPILEMLEDIRHICTKRNQIKRDNMKKWNGPICPKVSIKLIELTKKANGYSYNWNGFFQYEVEGSQAKVYRVDLEELTCSCRRWQLVGYPCAHAIACINHQGWAVQDYINDCYRVSAYKKLYSHCMPALHGKEDWPGSTKEPMLPPIPEKQPGRPKHYRRKKTDVEISEEKERKAGDKGKTKGKLSRVGVVMHCSYCGKAGHNKKTCVTLRTDKDQGIEDPNMDIAPGKKGLGGKKQVVKKTKVVNNTRAAISQASAISRGIVIREPTEKRTTRSSPRFKDIKGKGKEKVMPKEKLMPTNLAKRKLNIAEESMASTVTRKAKTVVGTQESNANNNSHWDM